MKIMVARCTRNLGIVITRALASSGHEIIGVDDRAMPLGLYSRFASQSDYYDASSEEEEFDAILSMLRRHQPEVLIASPLTGMLVPRAAELAVHTHCLLPPPEAYESITDKVRLHVLCEKYGIPAPALMSVQQAMDLLADRPQSQAQSRVVIKPRRDIGGGQGVHILSDAERIGPTILENEVKYGPSFVSEFVPGPPEDIVAVNLLFDRDSQLIGHFSFRKLRLCPPATGISALARSIFAPDLVQQLLPLFTEIGWQGPADAEYKIDEVSGEAKLLEINGRFSGALAFSIDCGVNFPALFCDGAIGTARPCDLTPRYPDGVMLWNPRLFMKSLWQEWRSSGNGLQLIRSGFRQARGRKVGNPLRFSDPAPTLGKLLIELRDWLHAKRKVTRVRNGQD